MKHVGIILGSTRQGREGDKVATWVYNHTNEQTAAHYELIDLRDWPLPFFDSPDSPGEIINGNYDDPQTRAWSEKISSFDGFIIVTPEYNHGYPGVLKNALDHLFSEWNGKPVSFVGYGVGAGGTRAVEQLRQVVIELRMIPLYSEVCLPRPWSAFDDNGETKDTNLLKKLLGIFDILEKNIS